MEFKVGDRVKYVSDNYFENESNPLFGGKFSCVGEVSEIVAKNTSRMMSNGDYYDNVTIYSVKWDNGHENSYIDIDLELVEEAVDNKLLRITAEEFDKILE